MATEVRLVNLLRLAALEVFIEARPLSLDAFFCLAAIKQIAAWQYIGSAVLQSINDVAGYVAGAWQYGLHELAWNVPVLNVFFREDEKIVGARGKATFDLENIPQVQPAWIAYRCRGRKVRPFAGAAQGLEQTAPTCSTPARSLRP